MSDPRSNSNLANENKIVKIKIKGVEQQFSVPLYLEEDISMQADNTYEDPIQKFKDVIGGTDIGKAIQTFVDATQVAASITGTRLTTRFSSPEAWVKSSKLKFSTKFSFYMGSSGAWDGKTEVYDPIAKLGDICLPKVTSSLTMQGPGPSYSDMLLAIGSTFVKGTDPNTASVSSIDDTNINSSTSNSTGVIHIKVGTGNILNTEVHMPGGVLPKNFSYTFSKELDSNGYPISGTCTIQWESFVMATGAHSFGDGVK